jgi:hypothetical protein
MSGPIIRKYGFANFEKIFGERELKHGADPDASKSDAASTPPETPKPEQGSPPASGVEEAPKKPTV